MKKLRHLPIVLLMALLALVSCDKQGDIDRSYTDFRYDIVTFLGYNTRGAVFEYLGRDDSSSVKLQSTVDLGNEVKTMQRVLLRYDYLSAGNGDSRDIAVYGCNAIFSDSLRQSMASPDSLPRHQVKLRSLWRTGEFINLHCQVEYTGAKRSFLLVADGNTLERDTVDCYLLHDLRGAQPSFWRDCYASFNVGALWRKDSFRCLRVHLNDVTFPDTEYYDFIK